MKKLIMKIKHGVVIFVRKHKKEEGNFYGILKKLNNTIFHGNEMLQKRCYGDKNADKIFYVIRRNGIEEGLMSLFWGVFREINYAFSKGYIPYVDFQNNITQYTTGKTINNTKNAWEYYFNQPSRYTLDEIYQSKNVILSGRSREVQREKKANELNAKLSKYDYNDKFLTHELCVFIKKYMDVQPYIKVIVNEIWEEKFADKDVIAVFARGTDYAAFKPSGHPIQPTKEMLYDKVLQMLAMYPQSKCFIVTEDDTIYSFMKKKLEGKIIEIKEDIRFNEYKGDDYLYKYCTNSAYQVGLYYLIKLILLSKCQYLVASITNGSKYVNVINDNRYKKKIVLNLGVYE